jgi:hypothetical protein
MVNENNFPPIENKRPFETIYEIKNEIPSFEEFMKDYKDSNLNYDDLNSGSIGEVRGYGPCKNSLCGCDCYSENCVCKGGEASIVNVNKGFRIGNVSASGGKDSAEASVSAIRIKDFSGDAKFLSATCGVNDDGLRIGLDAANLKTDGFQLRAGVNLDTGFVNNDDKTVFKLAGIGFDSDSKQIGLSLPFAEVKVDKDKCNIQ